MKAGNQGYVFIIDATTGTITKEIPYGPEFDNGKSKQGPGSHSTPTIDGDRLYMLSGEGLLVCYQLPGGTEIWHKDLTAPPFNGNLPSWGVGESVLIDGNNVICTPGGPGTSVVALDKMTGATVWQTTGLSESSSYCSPTIIDHNGNRILVTILWQNVVGIDPSDGTVHWKHRHDDGGSIVFPNTPVYVDGNYIIRKGMV